MFFFIFISILNCTLSSVVVVSPLNFFSIYFSCRSYTLLWCSVAVYRQSASALACTHEKFNFFYLFNADLEIRNKEFFFV